MAHEPEVNQATREADTVIAGQISDTTRGKYERSIRHFARYLDNFERHDGTLEVNDLDFATITVDEMKRFLNYMPIKRRSGPFSAVLIPSQ